eukprot:TRINITY_DN9454_c0_g1_i1.p1 TRINITY_DN9454_c0_g1~~TRINITY_DN9454_c0_g1_i1.p1  ORF type:complete len:392 (-),score=100.20 TRINITY_DN9454_c0_g1_i1:256-1431(-)
MSAILPRKRANAHYSESNLSIICNNDNEEEEEEEITTQKQLRTLYKSIHELIDSERLYINDLKTMINDIMIPMGKKEDFLTGEKLVTGDQMSKIWSNIQLLLPINETFLTELEENEDKIPSLEELDDEDLEIIENPNIRVGAPFLHIADYFKIYAQYCSNQPVCTKTVEELCTISQFEAFLMEKSDIVIVEGSHNLDLKHFLIKPVQRMCKYPLFIRELVKYTPSNHVDYQDLCLAKLKIDEVVNSINEDKKKHENHLKLVDISNSLSWPKKKGLTIVEPTRSFVKSGEIKKISIKKKSYKAVIFLFNDIILITKPQKKNKYKYQHHLVNSHATINDIDETNLGITHSSTIVQLSFENESECKEWKKAIKDILNKKKSKKTHQFKRASCSF